MSNPYQLANNIVHEATNNLINVEQLFGLNDRQTFEVGVFIVSNLMVHLGQAFNNTGVTDKVEFDSIVLQMLEEIAWKN